MSYNSESAVFGLLQSAIPCLGENSGGNWRCECSSQNNWNLGKLLSISNGSLPRRPATQCVPLPQQVGSSLWRYLLPLFLYCLLILHFLIMKAACLLGCVGKLHVLFVINFRMENGSHMFPKTWVQYVVSHHRRCNPKTEFYEKLSCQHGWIDMLCLPELTPSASH
jgi:hypothetical protein